MEFDIPYYSGGFMKEEVYQAKILKALQSKEYISVRRRVFRQLVESLIYEEIITPMRIQKESKYFLLYKVLMKRIKM